MKFRNCVIALCTMLALCWSGALAAQSVSTSQIQGTVTDAGGGAVPGAAVLAIEAATGFAHATATGQHGEYVLANLPPGAYALQVSKAGFTAYKQTGITLQVASNPTVNVQLKVGVETQEVTVSANAAMLETHATGVGEVVTNKAINDLPLNGRQATNLIALAGAATPGPNTDLNGNKNYPTQTISIAGGASTGIAFYMDGAGNNDPFNSLNLPFPFPDALQEFKVETGALSAQYGAHGAGAVNVVTKSGSNSIHGDLFEYVRNGDLNANDYFSNAKGLPRDSLKRNQFGATIGGPIVHNRLFFFAGYQGTVVRSNPPTRTSFVPNAAMLSGDFTTFASAACQGKAITLSAPFSGNTINPNQFSGAALNFLKHIPVSTDPCGAINFGISQNSHENQVLGRVDYSFSPRQTMFFRYFIGHYLLPIGAGESANILEANQVAQNDQSQSASFGDNYVLSPTADNVFNLSLNRTYAYRTIPPYPDPASLGIPVFSPIPGFMGLSVSGTGGGFSLGAGATNPGWFNSTAPQLSDDLTLLRGNHQIGLGVSWQHAIMNTVNNRPTNGAFSSNGTFTGAGLADFMLGDLSSFLQGNPDWENDRGDFVGAYVQDSWKASSHLTFNYGMRYEPFLQQHNWNRWVESFNLANFTTGIRSSAYSNAPAGLVFPGDSGYPGTQYSSSKFKTIEPHLGVIWDPTGSGRTVIRASYGLFYDRPQMFFYTRVSNNPPWGASVSLNNLQDGFSSTGPWAAAGMTNPWPTLAQVGPNMPFPAQGVYVTVPLQIKPTYVEQRNVGIQHQLGVNDVLSLEYLGNETTHLWIGTELDPGVSPAAGSSCYTAAGYNACEKALNSNRLLGTINPTWGKYYSTLASIDDGGTANYNGLIVREQHRLSKNYSMTFNYTWSHCISDPPTGELTGPTLIHLADRRLDRGNCAQDIRNLVNAAVIANAPWRLQGWAGSLANGWELSTIVTANSGGFSTAGNGSRFSDPTITGLGSNASVVPGQATLAATITPVAGSTQG
ncbi:MAG TPA: carboxypeptidase regulatory-like domain-containing protein, partial [Terriglobales bacterium]|nr:carboxypeptidase regulatory-like domain-containing protein [Terriglobales bacterium]